jgi:hypothetical protein
MLDKHETFKIYVFSLTIASSFDEILPGNTNSLIPRVTISRPVIG